MTIAQALEAVAEHPLRRAATVTVPIASAQGMTLAAAVCAAEDVPPFTRSRVDGFAVVASDVANASKAEPVRLTIVGGVEMGAAPTKSISRGEAMRIPTGGAMPDGADGVVMIEDCAPSQSSVDVYDGSDALGFVTHAGADVRAGDELFSAGTVVTPSKIGMLTGAGVATVAVCEPPVVGLLLTGDELVGVGEAIGPGRIRDINRYALSAALTAMGFDVRQFDRVPDERGQFEKAFERALDECDAVVISGGSSAGERDHTPDVVAAAGTPGVIVHHVLAKPGRPTLLGVIGDKPIVGLPGNPVSALVMLEAIGKPILLRMLGRTPNGVRWRAILAEPIDVSPKLEHRIGVRLEATDDLPLAHPLLGTSAQMHVLAFADGLVTVPLGVGTVAAGTPVDVTAFSTAAVSE